MNCQEINRTFNCNGPIFIEESTDYEIIRGMTEEERKEARKGWDKTYYYKDEEATKERNKRKNATKYKRHREKVLEQNKKWTEDNHEKRKAYWREYNKRRKKK